MNWTQSVARFSLAPARTLGQILVNVDQIWVYILAPWGNLEMLTR
jgi:hypothetical protein